MARETLRMMSNDERLTDSEVTIAIKYLLAKKLKKLAQKSRQMEVSEYGIEIHICNVREFFLESYVNSQNSLNAMMSPCKSKWVDYRSFANAVENIQQVSYEHSFFNKDELATTKNNLIRQKLLCMDYTVFFKLVDSNQKNSLSKFELKTVSAMALRSKKKVNSDNLDVVVQKAFEKANESRGYPSEFITFEEFYSVLKT